MDRLTLKICRQKQYRKAIWNLDSNFISILLVIYRCVFTCLLFAPWRMYVYIINFNLSKWFSDLFKSNYKCLLLVYIYIHRVFPTLFQKKKNPIVIYTSIKTDTAETYRSQLWPVYRLVETITNLRNFTDCMK